MEYIKDNLEEDVGKDLESWGLLLSSQTKLTSDGLSRLLDEQIEKRTTLLARKGLAESEAKLLITHRKKDVKSELQQLHQEFIRLKTALNKMTKEKLPNRLDRPEFYQNVQKADELEKAVAYLTVLNFITSTSEQIEANMESELETEAIELFHRLKRIEVAYLNITECTHLQTYGKGINTYWELKLTDKLVKDFEILLESFGWPMRLKTATPTLEAHEKFHRTIINLAKISNTIREGNDREEMNETYTEGSFTPIIPIQILMVSIKRRFRFHFLSDKATTESSRPEWYFSQLKQWLYELIPFVKTHLEQVTISEIGVSSIIEFVRCVSEMLVVKVDAHLQDDLRDGVFVKILEESIIYENDIGDILIENVELMTNNSLPPFVNTVFSRPSILKRWLAAERLACLEKLDDMFSSPSAWNKPVITGPPEIADLFIAVARSLIDRFAHLRHPSQRLQFLQLLNDLLEEFHVRCLQTWKSKTELDECLSKDVLIDYVIADALHGIHTTLQEWEYLPFFASLSLYCSTMEEGESNDMYSSALENSVSLTEVKTDPTEKHNALFANACSLYWCLEDEIQSKWCHRVLKKLREEIQPYSKIKWQTYEKTSSPKQLSEKLLRLIQTLKYIGKAVWNSMDHIGAKKWIKKLAIKLDEILTELVILPYQFSPAAIMQISFDFNTGIFPAFAEIGIEAKPFFGNVSSSLTILKLSTGEAMLLYDTLMNGNFETHEVALAELNISICQSDVIKILRNRCDLHL